MIIFRKEIHLKNTTLSPKQNNFINSFFLLESFLLFEIKDERLMKILG
jgi:hypothetical protein